MNRTVAVSTLAGRYRKSKSPVGRTGEGERQSNQAVPTSFPRECVGTDRGGRPDLLLRAYSCGTAPDLHRLRLWAFPSGRLGTPIIILLCCYCMRAGEKRQSFRRGNIRCAIRINDMGTNREHSCPWYNFFSNNLHSIRNPVWNLCLLPLLPTQ